MPNKVGLKPYGGPVNMSIACVQYRITSGHPRPFICRVEPRRAQNSIVLLVESA